MKTDNNVIDSSINENTSCIDERLNDISHNDEPPTNPGRYKKWTREYRYKFFAFVIIALIQIFVNYDNGVVPVILDTIQKPYNFKSTELGVMGALPHLGYFFLSPLLSHILSNYSSKTSLIISIFLNIVALGAFGLSVNKYMFFVAKFCIGVTQALYFTYYPLWVDTFAPINHRNLWMSIVQGGIVVGMTLGYVMTSIFLHAGRFGWRYSILTQIICELLLIVLFLFLPPEFVNFDPSRDDIVNFDLCTCEKQEINKADLQGSKLGVISENDDNSPDSNPNILSNRKETPALTHSENTKPNAKKDLKSKKDKIDKNLDVLAKDSNIGEPVSYLNQFATSNVEFTLKRCQSLNMIATKDSTLSYNEVSRIYSNLENPMINQFEYSKCSKCFLNNVKLYNEIVQIKKLSVWTKFALLVKQDVFILTCLAISSVYFEVFGIHFWMTKVAISNLKVKERAVHLIFSIETLAGPVLGIVSGSYLIDKLVYHYPQHPLYVDCTVFIWGSVACISGVVLIYLQTPMAFAVCISVILFFGAALVPPLTLSSVSYLPHNLKPAGASFFMCQYQVLGFMMGTVVPGIVVDIFKNYKAGLYLIFLSGYVGLISMAIIIYIKWSRIRKAKKSDIKIAMTGVPTGLPESDMSSSLELISSKRISDESVKKQGSNQKGTLEYKYKLYTFFIISLFQIFLNYDFGIMPVILNSIQEPYKFSHTELSIMGSLAYFGTFLSSPVCSKILSSYSSKASLIYFVFLNIVFLVLFGLSVNKYMFFAAKLCIGLTQSLYFIYYVLWVDIFAPPKNRNLWFSIIQGMVVIGMTIGYVMTSIFLHAGQFGWRYSVMTQAIGLGITVALFWMVPKKFIEFDPSRDDIVNLDLCTCGKTVNNPSTSSMETKYVTDETNLDDESHFRNNFNVKRSHSLDVVTPVHPTQQKDISRVYSNFDSSMINSKNPKCSKCFLNNVKLHNEINQIKRLSTWSKFMLLCKYKVFMINCLFVSTVYFEFTGIQYWMTKIGTANLNFNEKSVHIILSIDIIAGSSLGMVAGSYIIDQIIYHYPKYPLLVDLTILFWSLLACIPGLVLIYNKNIIVFSVCTIITILFGAALVPSLELTSIAYLPHNLKPTGASFFMAQYNVLGFMLGTLIPGVAIDLFNNYKAGVYIIYISGCVGHILYCITIYIKWSKIRKAKKSDISSINSTNIKI
ncbi:integral membrane protein [Theileria orientalis]|uniref:Integral membrane protein n=1 Tax=Theileria orientalis TaxID=68886 RepID=A0A976SIZ4_THEOR|nr:integral membrane protein [Theileria orientalis]